MLTLLCFLFQVRLCPDCSYKLNYGHKRKEITKKKKKEKKRSRRKRSSSSDESVADELIKRQKREDEAKEEEKKATEIWSAPVQIEAEKSREDDFAEYLEDLFL